MSAQYQVLARRINAEIGELEQVVGVVERHWTKVEAGGADPDAYLNSVALNLHSLYTGIERVFELIAEEFDGGALGGESWHTELLRQMVLDVPGVRPAVLQSSTAEGLDELRRFRHRVRNIYAGKLDAERIKPLVAGLPHLWAQLQSDLRAFGGFLAELGRAS